MKLPRSLATFAGLLCAFGAQAHEPAVSRYRVTQLPIPDSLTDGCVDGYSAGASITRINDFGVVNATANCYSTVDPATGTLQFLSGTFVAAPWFGAVELPRSGPVASYSYNINNRGELFGYEFGTPEGGGIYATKWSLAGGRERIFFDPACGENLQFQAAVDGNGRYTVGWALRGDPSLPPPVDQLCIKTRWVIRNAAGVETSGPLGGSPSAINVHDVAVGTVDRSAVRYHVPTGQLVVLHAADPAHSVDATDINDLGEVAGRISTNSQPDFANGCDPGVAVRWERDGREIVLPHLPGAVSSHAYGVGYDGETVGDSGAGQYCPFSDNSSERAVLWKGGLVYDLNTLIPRSAGITLTYAYAVNRRGQITAGGYVNSEPLTLCPSSQFDPVTGTSTITTVPCHNQRMFLLTPVGR
ncbi:MAG TPA: hypothetical protein VFU13_10230 [Steroidobacteraceae bacterium]|nr:hypothetical protein [Steroidobacteraceae bacterium]